MNKTSPTNHSATPAPRILRTLLAPLALLATSTSAEVTVHTSRPAFDTALGSRPQFHENFHSHSDRPLDTSPLHAFGGAVVVSAESSHNASIYIDAPPNFLGTFGVDSPSFEGGFIIAEANHSPSESDPAIGRGLLTFTVPQHPGQYPAIGFDFSGIAGWYADDRTLPVTFRVTTADGTQTTGLMVNADPVGAPHDDGFIGFTDPDSPIVSVELYNSLPYGHWTDNGNGEAYGIDNLTVSLLDSNADGIPDFYESKYGLNPADSDPDHDSFFNLSEFQYGTNPLIADSDADHFADHYELISGSDPTDHNSPAPYDLEIDFDSTGGAQDFEPVSVSALDGEVTVTPGWPDSTTPQTRFSRRAASTGQEHFTPLSPGNSIEILQDLIGVDTSAGAGGNGSFDGENGTPTRMTITLQGVPEGTYRWQSYHHDSLSLTTRFIVEVSTDAGTSYSPRGTFQMTRSPADDDEPVSQTVILGSNPERMPSTVEFDIESTGDNVIIRFTPLSDTSPGTRQFGINGFKLTGASTQPKTLEITSLTPDPILGEIAVTWQSKPGRPYDIEASSDLGFVEPTTNRILGQGRTTTFTETGHTPLPPARFYRVKMQRRPILK